MVGERKKAATMGMWGLGLGKGDHEVDRGVHEVACLQFFSQDISFCDSDVVHFGFF